MTKVLKRLSEWMLKSLEIVIAVVIQRLTTNQWLKFSENESFDMT